MEKLKKLLANLPHPIRWALIMLIGFALLILGLVMLVTPGPGLLFIFFGLSILALRDQVGQGAEPAGPSRS